MVHLTPFHWLSVVRSFALCVTRYFFCPRGMALNDQEERERGTIKIPPRCRRYGGFPSDVKGRNEGEQTDGRTWNIKVINKVC